MSNNQHAEQDGNWGPQCKSDDTFTARMRFHQSWYRATVLGVPCGVGPKAGSKNHYGNMLRKEDGNRGLNFLTPELFEIAQQRIAENVGMVEPFRCLNNMLSSQPMCFNLFGILALDQGFAARVFQHILPREVERVTQVVIEYAPEPTSEYLNDRTAFDAYVEYDRIDNTRGFIGIETKLTEPFSGKRYDGLSYRRWVERGDSPWPKNAWPRLAEIGHNQLWRDHVLAVSMLMHSESQFTNGYFMLVGHPGDLPCSEAASNYKSLLKTGYSGFLDYPLDKLVGAFESVALNTSQGKSLSEFKRRYLDLHLSEDAWQKRK